MKKHNVDITEEHEKLLKHIAKFIHDIRTPLFGITKNAEDAHERLRSFLPHPGTIDASNTDGSHHSQEKLLFHSVQSIEQYTQISNELVNEFWKESLAMLSESKDDFHCEDVSHLRPHSAPVAAKELKQVLLVDDNELNQQVGLEMLKELGFQVTIANDGIEALKRLETQDFLFILMDCRLPKLDGWKTTIEIRKKQLGANIPIIGLTASLDESDYKYAFEAGMNDCLSKPLTIETLERIVDVYAC